jgi:hypothetical protein
LSVDDHQNEGDRFPRSRAGPWDAPPCGPNGQPQARPLHPPVRSRSFWSVAIFILLISGVAIRAYQDLSRPEAWAYWKDQYRSPSLSSTLIAKADLAGIGQGRHALAVSGKIGPAAANWFRDRLDESHLATGDIILLSSPGGDLTQALLMGETIRSRGLVTAVGVADASGRVRPSYCASACVFAYAGGNKRLGIAGSILGVHRFVTSTPGSDPVADTQRTAGTVLGYMTKMGVSSSVVEAMSETRDVRWLDAKEALAMNLITDPLRTP